MTNVPTAAERNGDFSQSVFGVPINPFTGMPFPGGIIPRSSFIPSAARSRRFILCQIETFRFRTSYRRRCSATQRQFRRAHRSSLLKSRAAFPLQFWRSRSVRAVCRFRFSLVPGYGDDVTRRSQNAMSGETHVLSPELVNDLRFAFNRVAASVPQEARHQLTMSACRVCRRAHATSD